MPSHIKMPFKQWRSMKYSDCKRAIKAVGALRIGCAITPAMDEIVEAAELLEQARLKMRASEWK